MGLECPKRSFRLRLGRGFLENFNVFFTTKNLQLVYPPLWQGPFNENPCAKLRLGRSKHINVFNGELLSWPGTLRFLGCDVHCFCYKGVGVVATPHGVLPRDSH